MLKIIDVIKNGQAETLNILPEDILVSYNSINIYEKNDLLSLINKNDNLFKKKIPIVINRNGNEKVIFVNNGSLGLILKEMDVSDSGNMDEVIEKRLLDEANDTIRAANKRIASLKSELSKLAVDLEEEKNANVTCLAELTDLEVLGFTMTPSKSDLKKNYKLLSVIYHPDKSGSKRLMQRINNAYESVGIKSD